MGILNQLDRLVWGAPTLILILGTGIYLTVLTRGIQIRKFPAALRAFWEKLQGNSEKEGVSSYRALCTALAATVGTGNLAGVAGAIAIGGPGAIFWMWVSGLLGMGIKFAEATLAVRYRVRLPSGEYAGGPMYMIQNGMKRWKFLAGIYCFFGVVASFGVGNATQINTVIQGIETTAASFGAQLPGWFSPVLGCLLGGVIAYLFLGGAQRIGRWAEALVPGAACAYVLLCLIVLFARFRAIPQAMTQIFVGAFQPRAVTGGMVGSALSALRIGISRGVFTNEAGMGTASIAHGGAQVDHPWEQGYMGIIEVFLDTIVICTMTALVILCTQPAIPYGQDPGVRLTLDAFEIFYGNWIQIPITFFLCLFAFATVLGWGLYGGRCAQFLFGDGVWKKFVVLQGISVAVSAVLECSTVWTVAQIVNGCMAVPNLIALLALSRELSAITKKLPGRPRKRGRRAGKLRIGQ